MVVALGALVYGLIEAPGAGWLAPHILGLFAVASAAVVLLIWHERRAPEPFIDLRFFRSAPFSAATLTAVLGFAAWGAFLFINALYLQEVRGLSPFTAGLYMLPLAVCTLIFSLLSGRLVARFGTRPALLAAGFLICASGVSLTGLSATTSDASLFTSYVLFGLGFGMLNTPITTTAVSGMPLSQAGVAAGLASTSRQAGSSLGVALAGTVTGAGAAHAITSEFATATHPMWWITSGCGLAIAALGIASTTSWARASTARISHLLEEPTP